MKNLQQLIFLSSEVCNRVAVRTASDGIPCSVLDSFNLSQRVTTGTIVIPTSHINTSQQSYTVSTVIDTQQSRLCVKLPFESSSQRKRVPRNSIVACSPLVLRTHQSREHFKKLKEQKIFQPFSRFHKQQKQPTASHQPQLQPL